LQKKTVYEFIKKYMSSLQKGKRRPDKVKEFKYI